MNVSVANCSQQKGIFNRIFRLTSHLPGLACPPSLPHRAGLRFHSTDEQQMKYFSRYSTVDVKTKDPTLTLRVQALDFPCPMQ